MRLYLASLLVTVLFSTFSLAQTISGRITDASNSAPLSGAFVYSSTDTTVSTTGGQYALSAGQYPALIIVTYLGYQTEQVLVEPGDSIVNFGLTPASLSLNEVVVNAGLTYQKIRNAVSSISVVSTDMIQRDDPFTITNALNRVPGLYMHAGTQNTTRITIRGIGSRSLFGTTKIKAYMDQIPLTDGSGNSTIEDIDQGLIGRVEVIKGPNSSSYGAGLGGVVRLSPFYPEHNRTMAESQLTVGQFQTLRWANRFSTGTDKQQLSFVHSRTQSEGFRANSSYQRDQVGFTRKFHLNENSWISMLGIYTDLKSYIPSALNEVDFQNSPQEADANWALARGYETYQKALIGATYQTRVLNLFNVSSTVFFNLRNGYEPRIRPLGILDENTNAIGSRNILTFTRKKVSLLGGLELYRDEYGWQTFENLYDSTTNGSVLGSPTGINEESRRNLTVFVETNYRPMENVELVAGVSTNRTTYNYQDKFTPDGVDNSGDYAYELVWSPRIGAVIRATSFATFFTHVSHGFSPPTLEETLRPDGQINPDIRPEMGWNYETGVRGGSHGFNYDLTVYYMQIKDLLVADRVAEDVFVGVNAGQNNHLGIDFYANYFTSLSPAYTLNVFNSLAWMNYRFAEFTNNEINYDGNELTGVPEITLNPGIELLSEAGFYGNLNGQYSGRIPINDANTVYTDPYWVLRAKAGYRWQKGAWLLDIYAGANNLTDSKYASMLLINATGFGGNLPRYYYPAMPRHFYGGVVVKYTFTKK